MALYRFGRHVFEFDSATGELSGEGGVCGSDRNPPGRWSTSCSATASS